MYYNLGVSLVLLFRGQSCTAVLVSWLLVLVNQYAYLMIMIMIALKSAIPDFFTISSLRQPGLS